MSRVLFVFILGLFSSAGFAEITVTDDAGRSVVLSSAAQRVVSLSPHLTENLFSAGGGAALVATVEHSNFPESVKDLPKLGDALQLDWERLLALQPDLVLHWGSGGGQGTLAKLERLGFKVYVSEIRRIADIARDIRNLGELVGKPRQANQRADEFLQGLETIRQRYAGKRSVSVFYALWDKPLMTLGNRQIVHQALGLCGARNVFADLDALAPTVSLEALVSRQPELIVAAAYPRDRAGRVKLWSNWRGVSAVERGQWLFVEPDSLVRPTQRFLAGIESLCEGIDAFRAQRR